MQLRLPRPLWLAVATVGLVIAAVGLAFGVPAYRQWSAIDQIEHYGGFEIGGIRAVGPEWLRRCVGERRMLAFDEIHSLHFMPDFERHMQMRFFWFGPTGPVIDDGGLACVGKIPRLKHLHLGCTNITDAGTVHLCSLRELESLNLEGTEVSDASAPLIKRLTSLTELSLKGTRLTDAGMQHVCELEKLEDLDLSQTVVSDVSVPLLLRLKNLKELSLWRTRVSEDGLKELQRALPGLKVTR